MEHTSPTPSTSRAEDAFICVSQSLGTEWTAEAHKAVAELGLTPLFYQGLEKAHEGSSVSNEAHRDLWDCDVIIVAINEGEAQNAKALWVYSDIEVATRRGVRCLIYVRSDSTNGTFRDWPENVTVQIVTDVKQFSAQLRVDLRPPVPPDRP